MNDANDYGHPRHAQIERLERRLHEAGADTLHDNRYAIVLGIAGVERQKLADILADFHLVQTQDTGHKLLLVKSHDDATEAEDRPTQEDRLESLGWLYPKD